MFKIGDKVVPIKKSIGLSANSRHDSINDYMNGNNNAKRFLEKHGYLYVNEFETTMIGYDESVDHLVLGTNDGGGDFFAFDDVKPYSLGILKRIQDKIDES